MDSHDRWKEACLLSPQQLWTPLAHYCRLQLPPHTHHLSLLCAAEFPPLFPDPSLRSLVALSSGFAQSSLSVSPEAALMLRQLHVRLFFGDSEYRCRESWDWCDDSREKGPLTCWTSGE
ncbi:hypothetical protein E2C01_001391 [Portunus trituberculatus]|uniref:Uncharacterized protein n=1 Tax=Portunus trituberculatus TaxID=210409 RepID=A0A5B7CH66_PORTR|nr:hypothetical protein [Portunus trituberculatus]